MSNAGDLFLRRVTRHFANHFTCTCMWKLLTSDTGRSCPSMLSLSGFLDRVVEDDANLTSGTNMVVKNGIGAYYRDRPRLIVTTDA